MFAKFAAVLTLTVLTLTALTGTAHAESGVSGDTTQNGNNVKGASVRVDCTNPSGGTYYRTDTSNGSGRYYVHFGGNCPDGSQIFVTASKGDASGSASGIKGADSFDIALVSVAVPEFGTVTAVGAVGVVAAACFTLGAGRTVPF